MHKFWKLKNAWCCAPNESHAPALLELFGDTEMLSHSDGNPLTPNEAREICRGSQPWFMIFSPHNELIGIIALLRPYRSSAEVCLMLKKEWRGMGIGREALERLCDVAHLVMHLEKLYVRVLEDNSGAQAFFSECGFESVDTLPQHLHVPNEAESRYYVRTLAQPSLSLSIIIPTHNCAQWIAECLGSLEGIPCEIIVCDDHSDDATVSIVSRFAAADRRIRLVQPAERGFAGGARNTALRYATGEYIFFLDGDDRLCDKNVCRRMFMAAIFSRADMICSSEVEFFDSHKSWRHLRGSQYKGIIGTDERPMMYRSQLPVWMSWYRRDFIEQNNLKFAEGVKSYEDNLFSFMVASYAESMTTVPGPLVAHRVHDTSLSHINDTEIQTAFFEVTRQQYSYALSHGLCEAFPDVMRSCFFHSVFLTAQHVWHILGDNDDWIISDAVEFLRRAFPDMPDHLDQISASDEQKTQFALAWADVSAYLQKYRKELSQ